VHTTLDTRIQRAAEEELQRQLSATGPGLQGAVVVLDAASGDVLAWVGGRDFTRSRFDRVRDARRQAGSAFKPFVYAAAVSAGVPLSDFLEDQPLEVRLDGRHTWRPQNFEGTFEGRVTVRDALVRSKNVPTIRLAETVGIERVATLAERAGLEAPVPRQLSMPLGTVAVSPLELASAYTAFARLGEAVKPRLVLRVESPEGEVVWKADEPRAEKVIDPAAAYLVNDVLGEALVRGTGTAVRAAGFTGPAAGKTGTTNDGADVWFVGYTPDLVAAVWMGYDQPRSIGARATGGRLAAPVWARLMLRAYQGRTRPAPWAQPAGLLSASVDPSTGQRLASGCRPFAGAAHRELFLSGHVPAESCPTTGPAPVLAAELPPLEGFEEYTVTPDLPPVPLERTVVPADEDEDAMPPDEDEAGVLPPERAVPQAAPSPAASARPLPRPAGSPRPEMTPRPQVTPRPSASPASAPTPRPTAVPPPEGEDATPAPPEPTPSPSPGPGAR
jgi:penicillin-binding protein 1A